ncbi:MAG: anti-sigma factor family protein [Pyrinomonadaceae bacterium]
MNKEKNIINCSQFEELLTDYLDKTLVNGVHSFVAEHALSCPLCHALLNDVKESLDACRSMAVPSVSVTKLEARVLSMTMPETAMACEDFEGHLTDYLDGFLPAQTFHRWERHAALCTGCEDMPGMVVRSIAACYTYKMDELSVPAGLHESILASTIGNVEIKEIRVSWAKRLGEWIDGIKFPISVPQLAPLAMMVMFAFLVFSQTVSADGSLGSVYQKSFELAEATYQQSADALNGKPAALDQAPKQDPIAGTTDVSNEGN